MINLHLTDGKTESWRSEVTRTHIWEGESDWLTPEPVFFMPSWLQDGAQTPGLAKHKAPVVIGHHTVQADFFLRISVQIGEKLSFPWKSELPINVLHVQRRRTDYNRRGRDSYD